MTGCLIALGIAIVLVIISVIFVARSWRGWVSTGLEQGLAAVLDETQIDQIEKDEIFAHVELLMTKFTDKDVSIEDFANVMEELVKSPVLPTALVASVDAFYINSSDFDEAERVQSRIELARFSQGLFDESIHPSKISEVLAPVTTTTPDENDIRLNWRINQDGTVITALRSADKVTAEELRELVSLAKAHADEAGVSETPTQIDLSDEIAIAIALAIGEDPNDWLPDGVVYVEPVEALPTDDDTDSDTTTDDSDDDATDDTTGDIPDDDGP
ncbi:hypothetical protein COB72_09680 [bacterium]|nr:MAG: hypothetical protein COB72_09680 [bacterium]